VVVINLKGVGDGGVSYCCVVVVNLPGRVGGRAGGQGVRKP
jgi:hypothetical protein